MKNLLVNTVAEEICNRIAELKPTTQRIWVKMDVAQMMAHCSVPLNIALGNEKPKQTLLGKLIGTRFNFIYDNDTPFKKNVPTVSSSKILGEKEFEAERQNLLKLIQLFQSNGPEKVATHPHPFFGTMGAEKGGKGMYKHLDHHLKQFGI